MVVCSDAGLNGNGRWGMGWLVADRATVTLVAAGWWGGRQEDGAVARDVAEDINGLEAKALHLGLEVLAAIRGGRAGELTKEGGQLTGYRRRKVAAELQQCVSRR